MKNGYVIEITGNRMYHAGDLDNISEIRALKNM
jgi:L-ascorbate metabolism protein UlaG (beta-lactamase superfamily)